MTDAVPPVAPAPRSSQMTGGLLLVSVVGAAVRLLAARGASPNNMDADAAHFLNVARCFSRGQGFSNPSAWPAWMRPERLPMPETFKEPGFSWLISKLAPVVHDPFRAGQVISLVAGLALPLLLYALARNLSLSRGTALLAAALVAINPLLAGFSVTVMAESLFAGLITLAFALGTARRAQPGPGRPVWLDAATGVALGLAFMVRAQTLVALPAFAVVFLFGTKPLEGVRRFALALVAAAATASPFLMRNIKLFGTPFHSNVGSYGIWPYVDTMKFSHGLDMPPAPIGFALTHLPEVVRHMAHSAALFAISSLPDYILGNPVWVLALGVGALLALSDWRRWLFAIVFLGCTLALVLAVSWDERYFSSSTPLYLLLTACGAVWIAGRIGAVRLLGPVGSRAVLVATLLVLAAVQTRSACQIVKRPAPVELAAARAIAPWLDARLAPDESAMVLTTSYYAWFVDRPMVHLVIADRERFLGEIRRLKVRYAALPTSRLPQFAERFPGGHLPDVLVPDHVDAANDLSVFRVVMEPAAR